MGKPEEEEIEEEQERPSASSLEPQDIKLEKIVALPTWRELLIELVAAKKLDPWNIDIVEITSSYIERIKNMELLDLRVPANLILAAAILVRFKAYALKFEEEAQEAVEETYVEEDTAPEVIPVLELKTRIPPKRMVTLDELLIAMEQAFEEQKRREEKAKRMEIAPVINLHLPEFNIEEKMEEIYQRILKEKDQEGRATFSSLLSEKTPVEIVSVLLPLLHLAQAGRVLLFQEKFFGEIFIKVVEKGGGG
ncbi:MAG: ScpA family protein [Candidatus Anstonellaceae archaeon]